MYDGSGLYDFASALATANSTGLIAERVYDKREDGAAPRRRSSLDPIIGLFDGARCRRCDARFPALVPEDDPRSCPECKAKAYEPCDDDCHWPHGDKAGYRHVTGAQAHRLWHEWRDENIGNSELSPADDLAYYGSVRVFRGEADEFSEIGKDSLADTGCLTAPAPARLEQHRKTFEPTPYKGPSQSERRTRMEARRRHKQACDEIAALYGIGGDDLGRMVLDLRHEGLSVSEISEQTGMSERNVRAVLKAA